MSAMVPQRQIAATWKTLNIPDHLSYSIVLPEEPMERVSGRAFLETC